MVKSINPEAKAGREGGEKGGRKGGEEREKERERREAWSIECACRSIKCICTSWRILLQKSFYSGEAVYLRGAGFTLRSI